jgi:hypothetical protein
MQGLILTGFSNNSDQFEEIQDFSETTLNSKDHLRHDSQCST